MKKRLLAFLLALSIALSMLAAPASAAGNNTAVQFAITLGAMDADQSGALNAAVTRGAFAKMLTSYSTFRESVSSQGAVGTLYTDLPGTSADRAGRGPCPADCRRQGRNGRRCSARG